MSVYEGICDRDGWPLGKDFFVRVHPKVGRSYLGWVEQYDADEGTLFVRCEKKGHLRPAYPRMVVVTKPTTLHKARRVGHGKSCAAYSKQARDNRKIFTPQKKT